jgi:LacI family transcriptional regulator
MESSTAKNLKRPLLKDVAERAGVSVGLASRILRNYGSFSQDTKSRVLEAARVLGYQPDAIARALKVGRTRAIGVLISDIVSTFFANLVRGIEDVAAKSGYSVILCNTDESAAKEKDYLTALFERNVDGLIICASPGNDAYLRKIVRGGTQAIFVFRKISGLQAPRITTDNESAFHEATNYLFELGHRDIGIITGISGVQSNDERLAGYRNALEERGTSVQEDLIVEGGYQTELAYQAAKSLLDRQPRPTAVLVCSEPMTLGLLHALKERRLEIPQDISVIGLGDPAWANYVDPPLTMIKLPSYHMGLLAGETLINLLVNSSSPNRIDEELTLMSKLVIRESCRRI